jgi:PAS domain-containing protein
MSGNFDYQKLFEKLPGLYLVLDSELFILSASDAYLRVTMTVREKIVGRYVFDVFPDNPADPTATGEKTIGESMRWVLEKGVPDAIYAKQYDIQRTEAEGGGFVERFWNAYQLPIFDANGKIAGILQQVEDVTELIKARGEPRHEGNHPRPGPAIGRNDETLLKLKESQERYELALSGSNDGLWDWNVVTNRLFWSERFKEMLGITDKNFQPSYEEFKIRIHPNER